MRIIRNFDVSSYYPHLMTINGYVSRNIPSPKHFEEILEKRMQAKVAGDKETSDALKLVVNTTNGATLNQYNDLYDPLMPRSVSISGELYLLELAGHFKKDIPDLRIIQLNTDGIMIEFDDSYYRDVIDIVKEWENRTGFEMEEDKIVQIAQRDVNNYIEVKEGGAVKAKGGELVRGISSAGQWNINNNACIIPDALIAYFVNGIPPDETINQCNDIFKFQFIAKGGHKYKEVYQETNGEKQIVQNVNRVYANKDQSYGTLYKVKAVDDSISKIPNLPEHCLIDNSNKCTIDQIDKLWYINLAKEKIKKFKGENVKPKKKGGKKLATSQKNIWKKLLEARTMFLEKAVTKSGKNRVIKYKYFELEDIVPPVTEIFQKVGLIAIINFHEDEATMNIVNVDIPEETITFSSPMRYPNENKGVNPVQGLGAAQTYLRRYLYMVALDICEPDEIEQTTVPDKPKTALPVSAADREKIKQKLTSPQDKASDLQIKGLKRVLKELREKDPSQDKWIGELAVKTKAFSTLTKTDCEKLIKQITEKINAVD